MTIIRHKLVRAFSVVALSAMVAVTFAVPASASSGATIADTAIAVSSLEGFDSNDQDFDILIQALLAADLVDAVADPDADLTVFAPTDRAFVRLAKDFGYTGTREEKAFETIVGALTELGDGDPLPVLTNVLLYHVAPGVTSFAELEAARTAEVHTLLGESLRINVRQIVDAAPARRNAFILPTLTDVNTTNGVIHGISRVLLPVAI